MSVTQPLIAERYRLVRALGEGGMGRVWLALDEVLHRDVAIKEVVPPPGLSPAERDDMRRRTLREARTAARLTHPNVVRVYDVVQSDRHPWIVMEYVPSRSLHQVINEDGPLPSQRVAEIGLGVLGALRAAHDAGVTHRDVKPGNVLLTDDGRVVLTDFGLAIMVGEANVTRPGLILGSPAYIAPERARDGLSGPESDLWSLGATLYAAVEGRSPYARSTAIATLTALATEEPPPPVRAGPLRPLLDGLLRKDPGRRISAAQAEALLRKAAGGRRGFGRLKPVPRRRTTPADAAPPVPAPPPVRGRASVVSSPVEPVAPAAVEPGSMAPAASASPAAAAGASVGAPASVESASPGQSAGSAPSGESAGSGGSASSPASVGSASPGGSADPVAPEKVAARVEPSVPPVKPSVPSESPGLAATSVEPLPRTPIQPVPARERAGRTGYLWVLGAGVLVVLLVALLVANAMSGRSKPRAGGPQASAVASTAGRAATPTGTPTGTAPASAPPSAPASPELPAGWQIYHDPTGFSVAAPVGWSVSKEGTIRYFRDGTHVFGIDQSPTPHWDPVADWTEQERQRANTFYPGYQRIKIAPVNYFLACADWEFTYNQGGSRVHVVNRGFVTSDHQAYGIWWSTPEGQWNDDYRYFDLITKTFQPKP